MLPRLAFALLLSCSPPLLCACGASPYVTLRDDLREGKPIEIVVTKSVVDVDRRPTELPERYAQVGTIVAEALRNQWAKAAPTVAASATRRDGIRLEVAITGAYESDIQSFNVSACVMALDARNSRKLFDHPECIAATRITAASVQQGVEEAYESFVRDVRVGTARMSRRIEEAE